ncbi:MAG TPA: UDP-N-acetylmuramoyl-tripeptide--D-alanyl-D-alanine ligase [Puia sp.]|nr:UDP-N-acetylmuramoyl-tripeptide--D-alanyl-D-alanine ligase [Puia sp.]
MTSIANLYSIFREHPSIQTDTRKIRKGDIFFALRGPNFNGNSFATQALEMGASYVVVDQAAQGNPSQIIVVDDVLITLQNLAKFHREQFSIPVLAITGSNGKTTTKELIHAVLSTAYKTYTTKGNLNNHIGIPISLLQTGDDAEMIVIEMGANHQGEIAGYCHYVLPTHGLITNAGKAHLEGFGGTEGVRKGKGELFDFIRAHQGTAFVMWDYDYLRAMSQGIREVIRYGTGDAEIEGAATSSEPFLEINVTRGCGPQNISTKLVGDYNLPNVLASVAVGCHFRVPAEKITKAIEEYVPSNSRSQLIEKDSNRIFLDAYNANPTSMRAAIENFARQAGEDKILVLGAMAELGEESVGEHQGVVDLIQRYPWKAVLLVGGDFMKTSHPYHLFATNVEAKNWLHAQNFKNSAFLVKGSRSMEMEKVIE